MSSSIRAVSVAVGLVVALAGVAWLASANEAHLRFLLAKPRLTSDIFPMGIRDLVATSDAIVRARQVSLAFAGYLQEYDYETGQPIWVDPDAPTPDGLPVIMVGPVTDVTILVLESLYGELTPGSTATVRVSGNVKEDLACEPGANASLQQAGAEFLFFLGLEPDGVTFGLPYGNASRLNMLGPRVVDTACPGEPIWYTGNTAPDAFMLELRELLDSPPVDQTTDK